MSHSDPLDGKIREALADLVSQAPMAPDFDDIETKSVPQRKRPSRPVAWAAAAVVAVVLAGAALAGTDDTTVDTGMARPGQEGDGGAATSCEERAMQFAAEETDVLVFLEPQSSSEQHDQLVRELGEVADVDVVRFVDQDATYDEFRELFADSPEIVGSVTAEILPPRFELRLADSVRTEVITEALGSNPAVREVTDADQAAAAMAAQCRDGESQANAGESPATTVASGCDVPRPGSRTDIVPGPSDPPTMPGYASSQEHEIAHAQSDGQRVEIHTPGIVVRDLVGEQVEEIQVPAGPAQLWITDDFAQVRWFPGTQDPCDSFTVTAAGSSVQANRDLAVSVASDLQPNSSGPRPGHTEAAPDVPVLVLNGSGRCGIAGNVADTVRAEDFAAQDGLDVLPPANAWEPVDRTTVYAEDDVRAPAERIADLLRADSTVVQLTGETFERLLPNWDGPDPSIVVLLGSDQASAWPGC